MAKWSVKCVLKKQRVNRIRLVQGSDQWRTFVNIVVILGIIQGAAVSRADDWLFAPQEGPGYTQIF
jgi:hypothetical protein